MNIIPDDVFDSFPNERKPTISFPTAVKIAVVLMLAIGLLNIGGDEEKLSEGFGEEENTQNYFVDISLGAHAAFVFDVKNDKILYSKNANTQLPLASLVKVMTAVLAVESLSKNETILISQKAVKTEGNSSLRVGERWRIRDLIDLTLITSSNDGASALAAAVLSSDKSINKRAGEITKNNSFVEVVRQKAREIGMDQTYFINESGLDVSDILSGAYGSAHDIAKLFSYVIKNHPTLLEATTRESETVTSLDGFIHFAQNTNKKIDEFPSVIASKTGFTTIAGGNLAIAFEAGPMRPIIIVVLGSTRDGRFIDVEKLIWETLKEIQGK